MMGSLLWHCVDGLSGLLGTEGTAPPSFFPQPHNPPAFLLPVRLNVRLNYRSNCGKGKKSTYICIALTCCPFPPFFLLPFPSFLTCRPNLSFFSLFLVALIGLAGAVIFEMLGKHGMGERRADCTHHQELPLFQVARSIVKTHFRHKKQSLWFEARQA